MDDTDLILMRSPLAWNSLVPAYGQAHQRFEQQARANLASLFESPMDYLG